MPSRTLPSPLGPLHLRVEDGAVVGLAFVDGPALGDDPLLDDAASQLLAYFAGQRRSFELPLAPQGTPFQRAVWAALGAIPYGQTRTYGQLAAQLGDPGALRAVGRANGSNPIALLIPCHRVIGADGALTGYAGGLDRKRALLELEGSLRQAALPYSSSSPSR